MINRILKRYFCIGIVLTLISCASTNTNTQDRKFSNTDASRLSVVVVVDKTMFIPKPAGFAWQRGGTHSYMDSRLKNVPIISMLKEIIQEELVLKGFNYTESMDKSDFLVMFTVAVEDALSDEAINKRFGVQPGLQSNAITKTNYTKGTLVIDIQNRHTHQLLLRGAIQGFAKLDLSDQDRKLRLRSAVQNVLEKLPNIQ